MKTDSLKAISPIDGRYNKKTSILQNYFSEYSFIKYRVRVEIEYFIALCNNQITELNHFSSDKFTQLRKIYQNFNHHDASRIKEIEEKTNHDVKAVEYFIKEKFKELNIDEFKEFIHFGLTSQDINNTAVPLSVKESVSNVYVKELKSIISILKSKSEEWEKISLLARTHGQAASPTRMGKEVNVFIERIDEQLKLLNNIPFSAKFGGATGNFNAHHVAYKNIDWKEFADSFICDVFEMKRQQTTTQIEHYDHLAALMHNMCRINTILIDLCKDIWTYISLNYFNQKIKEAEVGSSAMPHKVNPIDFENAEGNLGIANSIFEFLAKKLPVSRLQRDLTDSTVLRNIGVPFAHTIIAFLAIKKGLNKLLINEQKISKDLEENWAVVAEGIQTILRREGHPNPYETLKDLTRKNEKINANSIKHFIENLNIDENVKQELKNITPFNYTGI